MVGRGPESDRTLAVIPGTTVPARTIVLLLVAAFLALGGVLARPASVLAECSTAPQSAEDAVLFGDVVFVGTVLRTENLGRWPTVRVEERWKGARALAENVVVRGGPEPGTATTVDRTFLPGRYLFIVVNQDGVLLDNACSGTRPWTEDLAALRPAGVSPAATELPTDPVGDITPGDIALVAGLLVALIVAIMAYLYVLRVRRRPPDWIR